MTTTNKQLKADLDQAVYALNNLRDDVKALRAILDSVNYLSGDTEKTPAHALGEIRGLATLLEARVMHGLGEVKPWKTRPW